MNENEKENAVLQWHPGFYAGLQIELAEEAHHLSFENEHQLGTKPKEIDVLVIKKDSNVAIRKILEVYFVNTILLSTKVRKIILALMIFIKFWAMGAFTNQM